MLIAGGLLTVAGCGDGNGDTTSRQAHAPEVCPNINSVTVHISIRNTLSDQAAVSTDDWSCTRGAWSEGGNPGKFDGQVVPAFGSIPRVRLEAGEKTRGSDWTMRFAYPTGTGSMTVRLVFPNAVLRYGAYRLRIISKGQQESSAAIGTIDIGGGTRDLVATVTQDAEKSFTINLEAR